MSEEPAPAELLNRLKGGDPAAARLLFNRFAARLVALARGRLEARVRQKVDPEDVVQSVFRSFFERQSRGDFEFDNWEGVWGLLVLLTVRKCGRRACHFRAARRDVRREEAPAADAAGSWLEALADDPTPEEAVQLTDLTAELFRRLKSDADRRVLELSLQGYSVPDIHRETGQYERGVERARARIKTSLAEMLAAG